MRWQNLAQNRCPDCGSNVRASGPAGMIYCGACPFKIRPEKMREIVAKVQARKDLPKPQGDGWERFGDVHKEEDHDAWPRDNM